MPATALQVCTGLLLQDCGCACRQRVSHILKDDYIREHGTSSRYTRILGTSHVLCQILALSAGGSLCQILIASRQIAAVVAQDGILAERSQDFDGAVKLYDEGIRLKAPGDVLNF